MITMKDLGRIRRLFYLRFILPIARPYHCH